MSRFISYLITDPKYYSSNPIKLKKKILTASSRKKVNFVCYRDKSSKNFKQLAVNFLKISKKINFSKILLNSDIDLAYRLKYDGVHLPSNKLNEIKRAKKKRLFVIASTHNFYELNLAIKNGADMVVFSPVFYTPNKGEPKGLNTLRKAVFHSNIPVIALGGIINRYQIHKVKIKKASGFSSIRYFIK